MFLRLEKEREFDVAGLAVFFVARQFEPLFDG